MPSPNPHHLPLCPRQKTATVPHDVAHIADVGHLLPPEPSIGTHNLKPPDDLLEQFTAWKAIVRQLTAWFECIAEIKNNTARDMMKLTGVIQVPFQARNQFLG
ncbi:uncharacterized protein LACBIDRAFT_300130 [Laccaria bicolor S238N-H82]|uniref:Predicted protein n=1 Tax=Laccaria bicolor (strain S238N-H82 / ATCC MYA-4686) TaxID=486041 RepID=B0DG33_LACBS|nr:uncharacterized protein LACBIDRAFT_300130 [Laccaria bicolor S238N-H82]EDR06572.1 predicted protein [Laccaria bicolor S238N-H82]|eukprot:XP_001882944.1 predicted protein [Laccaria bicolor S238N-H82]